MAQNYTSWFKYILVNRGYRTHVTKVMSEKTKYDFMFGPIRWGHLVKKITDFIKSETVHFELLIPVDPQEFIKDSHKIKYIRRRHISESHSPLKSNEVVDSQIQVVPSRKNKNFLSKMEMYFDEDEQYNELKQILPLVGQVEVDVVFYVAIPDNTKYQIKHFMQAIGFFKPRLNLIKAFELLNLSLHDKVYNQAMVKKINITSEYTRRGFSHIKLTVKCDHNTLYEV